MVRNEAVLAAAEIDYAARFVYLIQRPHVPLTIRDLIDQLSVRTVMIDMPPATAIAKPKERTVFQVAQTLVDDFDPRLGALAKYRGRLAVIGIGGIQIEETLFTILRLVDDPFAVRRPTHAHDQSIFGGVFVSID